MAKYYTKKEKELAERRADVARGGAGARKTGIFNQGQAPGDTARVRLENKLQRAAQGEFGAKTQAKAREYINNRVQDPDSPFYDPEEAEKAFKRSSLN